MWPFYSVVGWVCDYEMYSPPSPYFPSCVIDGEGDGHRSIIMTNGAEVGCGVVQIDTRVIETCDEGSGNYYATRQIASGAHIFTIAQNMGPNQIATTYSYLASYSSSTVPSSANVYVHGTAYALTLQSGSSTAGTYTSTSFTFGSTDSCIDYYFDMNGERYPDSGYFYTYGAGACTTDYSTVENTGSPTGTGSQTSLSTSGTNAGTSTGNTGNTGNNANAGNTNSVQLHLLLIAILVTRVLQE